MILMDPVIAISLVDYIHLLHKGSVDKWLFFYFERELKYASPMEINLAIDNLIIRYINVENLERTVAKFIRSVAASLKKQAAPVYAPHSIFFVLRVENRVIDQILESLKEMYQKILPELKNNNPEQKLLFLREIEKLQQIRKHYYKLQYGLFSALESKGAPTHCIQLMWHLEDSVWPKLNQCREILNSETWDFNLFNKIYGQMFYLFGTLRFREDEILFPVAAEYLSREVQIRLMRDAETYGILK